MIKTPTMYVLANNQENKVLITSEIMGKYAPKGVTLQ